jgi:hypothetical protein
MPAAISETACRCATSRYSATSRLPYRRFRVQAMLVRVEAMRGGDAPQIFGKRLTGSAHEAESRATSASNDRHRVTFITALLCSLIHRSHVSRLSWKKRCTRSTQRKDSPNGRTRTVNADAGVASRSVARFLRSAATARHAALSQAMWLRLQMSARGAHDARGARACHLHR